MLYSANSLCPCGSGKKYKRCCRAKDEGMRRLFEKASSGQIPATAQISSQNGEVGSMEVSRISITEGGKTTVLLDEKVTLATNFTSGDRTQTSVASISIPTDGLSRGAIRTVGNASVSNTAYPKKVALAGGVKKLKANNNAGLFVVARTRVQGDTQIEFFDILFGTKGQSENIDGSGIKQRPHIALYPDGNGKFIRLSGHQCEIEGDMQYCSETHQVLPQILRIKSSELGVTVEVVFSTENPDEFVLTEIRFQS